MNAKQLAEYSGHYKGPADWPDIEVRSIDGTLYSTDTQSKTELHWVAVEKNLFYVANTGAEVSFTKNEDDEVTHLNLKVESGQFSFARQALE